MKSFTIKHRGLRFLTCFAVVCFSLAIAVADNGDSTTAADDNAVASQISLEERLAKTISVEFRKAAIEDVLRIMADQANVDIVKSPKVTGEVTVTLTDVPLEEALNNILSVHGFTHVLSQNMIRVITAAEQVEKPEILQTKTFEIVYADVTEVVKALEKFKSSKGFVSFIQGTSHIIVTDTESKIRDITLFIEKIDVMTKQILVEARIYDITSKDRIDLGIQWEAGRNTTYPGGVGTNPTGGSRNPFGISGFTSTARKTDTLTGGLRLGWLNSGIDLDFLLTAQKEIINAKLLANPRILVLDNETAKIDIVSEIPYQELQQGGGATQSFGTTAFKEVGVVLQVTPHIAARDQMVRLKLKPRFSVQTGTVDVGDPSAGVKYPQPVIDKREAETVLLIKNGVTVVLGGLRKKNVTSQVNKIPILGDIPIVGKLFRFKGEDTVISEIIVFITPWIIEEPVLTSDEQQVYGLTEFKGPKVTRTRAEKKAAKDN